MSKWLGIVVPVEGETWVCVFDFEINEGRVISEFRKKNDSEITNVYCREVNHCGFILPEISKDTLIQLEKDISKENWFEDMFTLLSLNQPILSEYLKMSNDKHGEITALIGMIVYRLLELQLEEKL